MVFYFSSEAVGEGHPDKICDQISDSILDACLAQDPNSRVAIETCCKGNSITLNGEISTLANINYMEIVRETVKKIGYDSAEKGLDPDNIVYSINVSAQSPDIAQAVDKKMSNVVDRTKLLGAGDQGIMFGYATDETAERMPLTHQLAMKLIIRLSQERRGVDWCDRIFPDCKAQVSVRYEGRSPMSGHIKPLKVDNVVISTQHNKNTDLNELRDLLRKIIAEVLGDLFVPEDVKDESGKVISKATELYLNPSGRFIIGGPAADAGLTGRKIIVDTYGGWGSHGGGAFSGKDSTKVDRSACYAARWIARSLVDNRLCNRALIELSYSIGITHPTSICVEDFGTSKCGPEKLLEIVNANFDLSPANIISELRLTDHKAVKYYQTARFGHFGHHNLPGSETAFPWEVSKELKGLEGVELVDLADITRR
ncbi:S-adenosylmethionine synthetase [Carpediemonas membranifera]|uniref:S-adenosylmethionine synthase n=1 Tax=Carpediemonas membranifera TaxID=201153 RepID=A0A8J6AY23_9EUKA|nr:S-adenosylmethionine synthetase [Carpediemonas membranifera]|eukprot:KAG9395270.1 S-adenosylmethionine synthetase [Carpediemonas membranifera]